MSAAFLKIIVSDLRCLQRMQILQMKIVFISGFNVASLQGNYNSGAWEVQNVPTKRGNECKCCDNAALSLLLLSKSLKVCLLSISH